MRNRILIVFLVLTLVALPFMAACAKPAPVEAIEIKIANFQPATHRSNAVALATWTKKVEEATGGKVKFTVYPGATLAKPADTYDAAVTGIADMAHTFTGYSKGRFPLSEVVVLPALGFKGATHGARVLFDLYDQFPEIRAEYKDVHFLWFCPSTYRQIHSAVPIPTLADMEGKKLRAPGAEAAIMDALGATAVSMPGPEVYLALEKGVVDATYHPWEAVAPYKFEEVAKYHTTVNLNLAGLFVCVMNLGTWNKLPPDVQKVIDESSGRWAGIELAGKKQWDEPDVKDYEWLKGLPGHEFFEWSEADMAKARELTKPVVDKWVADLDAKGLPGTEILDECLRLIEKYK